jgi:nitronate monooxygenase
LDAVIAQGFEAGGHRRTFNEPFELGGIGLFSLLPQVVDALRIPVVATGGIAEWRGIAAALALGAKGVQLVTALLGAPEPSSIRCFGARCTNLALRTRSSRAASASSSFRVKVSSRTCGHMT